MKLFVGLGNPGKKYINTRHNIGYMVIDQIAHDYNATSWRKKFHGQFCEIHLNTQKAILLKPETFMNLSGRCVYAAMQYYKLTADNIIVFHDDLDLPPKKLRLKSGGGHAGHNGLRSLNEHIGRDYYRIRLGIGHPGDKNKVSAYVLNNFTQSDQIWINTVLSDITQALPHIMTNDTERFINAINNSPVKKIPTKTPINSVPKTSTSAHSTLQKLLDKFKK